MTYASDTDLIELIKNDQLMISPSHSPEEAAALIQPASIDLRLGHQFRIFRAHSGFVISPAVDQTGRTELVTVPPDETFTLHPGQFVLGVTYEFVRLQTGICGRVEGKSSLGRLGLLVHHTAGWIDPGFGGYITLELRNLGNLPIMLTPGMAIAQLTISALHSPATRPYGVKSRGSHYQGQVGPTPSRAHENFKIWDVYADTPWATARPAADTTTVTA